MDLNPAFDGHKKAQEAQNEKLGDRSIVTRLVKISGSAQLSFFVHSLPFGG